MPQIAHFLSAEGTAPPTAMEDLGVLEPLPASQPTIGVNSTVKVVEITHLEAHIDLFRQFFPAAAFVSFNDPMSILAVAYDTAPFASEFKVRLWHSPCRGSWHVGASQPVLAVAAAAAAVSFVSLSADPGAVKEFKKEIPRIPSICLHSLRPQSTVSGLQAPLTAPGMLTPRCCSGFSSSRWFFSFFPLLSPSLPARHCTTPATKGGYMMRTSCCGTWGPRLPCWTTGGIRPFIEQRRVGMQTLLSCCWSMVRLHPLRLCVLNFPCHCALAAPRSAHQQQQQERGNALGLGMRPRQLGSCGIVHCPAALHGRQRWRRCHCCSGQGRRRRRGHVGPKGPRLCIHTAAAASMLHALASPLVAAIAAAFPGDALCPRGFHDAGSH